MGFDDWGIGVEMGWNEDPYWENEEDSDWNEDPEWGHSDDWVENQKEVELVFDILVHTSDGAYLLQFDEKNEWFPKSISTINMSMHKNTVQAPMWFVKSKELEDYCTNESVVQEKTKTEELFNKVVRKNIRDWGSEEDVPF